MSTAQRATLKTHILATPDLTAAYTNGDLTLLASLLNSSASPSFTLWKSNVTIREVGDNINGSELAGLSTLNTTRLQTVVMLSQFGVNPSLADRRAFFDDIFSGAGGTTTRAQLLVLWKRLSTRLEKVFATGTGSDAVPAILVIEGPITTNELIGL